MKLLADESVEQHVLDRLRAEGHDVLAVSEVMPGADDDAVLARGEQEQRILVTNDKDFAALAFLQRKARAGILLVRMPKTPSTKKAERVAEVVQERGDALAECMTVVDPRSLRRRAFPEEPA